MKGHLRDYRSLAHFPLSRVQLMKLRLSERENRVGEHPDKHAMR